MYTIKIYDTFWENRENITSHAMCIYLSAAEKIKFFQKICDK